MATKQVAVIVSLVHVHLPSYLLANVVELRMKTNAHGWIIVRILQ